MSQVGYPQVCDAVAAYLCDEQGVTVSAKEVVMTCGAAGALNVILKTLLDPGDEVILTKPVFIDYGAYVDNHGGSSRIVDCRDDFMLDLDAIGSAINEKTKAMIINSPNNPSGQIYSEENLLGLGKLLEERSKALGRTIYLLSDEPYRKIVFDGHQVPSIFKAYAQSIIATSYSKDLSIPGERIGYAAVNPAAEHRQDIMAGMTLATRILGFINAPALMQRVIAQLQGISVDIGAYHSKRDLLCQGLADAGYEFLKPPGTFYLFPKTPIEDDVAFVQELQKELILTVPGKGFLYPGYFRIAFCVDDDTIINSLPGFRRVMDRYK
jgi:aspartate aminotransferase